MTSRPVAVVGCEAQRWIRLPIGVTATFGA